MTPASRPVAFVLASTDHGPMITDRHDDPARDPARGHGPRRLRSAGLDVEEVGFAKALLRLRRRHFGDGVLALDCGAGIGVHTVELARAMRGWGEVAAFEAREPVFYALAGNIALNNCFNARAFWAAVGDAPGTIELPRPEGHRAGAPAPVPGDDATGTPVSVVSLDSLGLERADLIRIEAETRETEILAGAEELLRRCRPQLVIRTAGTGAAAPRRLLEEIGYRTWPMGTDLLALHRHDPSAAQLDVIDGGLGLRA